MAASGRHATLGIISFGFACGVTFALFAVCLGLMATLFGWGMEAASALSSIFIGYGPGFVGTIAGAVWGFATGLVAGGLIAWLYNKFLLRRQRHAP
jgi:hypothetical protein